MAAERNQRLNQILRKLPHDSSILVQGPRFLAPLQEEVIGQFRQGILEIGQATAELTRQIVQFSQTVSDVASEAATIIANQRGYDTLAINLFGARTADWFNRTQRAYSSGLVDTGIGIGMIHPDIGMAASNTSLLTDEVVSRFVHGKLQLPETPSFSLRADTLLDEITINDLRQTTTQAMNITLQEFIGLSPHCIPGADTMLIIFGIQNAKPNAILAVKQTVMRFIKNDFSLYDGQFQKTGGQIGLSTMGLGHAGELIYGGTNHPKVELREPQVILQR